LALCSRRGTFHLTVSMFNAFARCSTAIPTLSILIRLPSSILDHSDSRPFRSGALRYERPGTMTYGKRRGWSDCIKGANARTLMSAHAFAVRIGRPLNVSIDINWSKTSASDDHDGSGLRAFRKAAGRFLRARGAGGLTCTWARERPTSPVPRPNAHLNCHIPARLYDAFIKAAHRFLPRGCIAWDREAIWIQLIGLTLEDSRRRSEYLVKGAHPRARLQMNRKRIPQGRIHGKRSGTSEDIGSLARLRGATQQTETAKATPY
jgi:hypothetical protein